MPVVNTQIQTQASAPQQPAAPLPTHSQRRRRLRPHQPAGAADAVTGHGGPAAVLVMAAGLWWSRNRARRARRPRVKSSPSWRTEEPVAPMVQPARQADGWRHAPGASCACARAACIDPEPMPQPGLVVLEAAMRRRAGAPAGGQSAGQLCQRRFWARSMCIHQACQEDGIANHPVCVDERVRREAQERQRQL